MSDANNPEGKPQSEGSPQKSSDPAPATNSASSSGTAFANNPSESPRIQNPKNGSRSSSATADDETEYRFPVQLYIHESRTQKIAYFGPIVIASISLLVSVLTTWFVVRVQKRQTDLQQEQTKLQERQIKADEKKLAAELAELRLNFLRDVLNKDENSVVLAELALAGHGGEALPVVFLALGVEESQIRESGVRVVQRMYELAPEMRQTLVDELRSEANSPNPLLRLGVVQSLVGVQSLLTQEQYKPLADELRKKFPLNEVCTDENGRRLVQQLALFFRIQDSTSVMHLLPIVANPRCGDGWRQAVVRLEQVICGAALGDRQKWTAELEQSASIALNNLAAINPSDLESGGFHSVTSVDAYRREVTDRLQDLTRLECGL